MLTYTQLKRNRRKFVALTGIPPRTFQSVLQAFQTAYEGNYPPGLTMAGTRRQRQTGGGRRGSLDGMEQKVLFALVYQRIHPAQGLLGAAFGISQTRANRWIHILLPVLDQVYKDLEPRFDYNSCRFASPEGQAQRPSGMLVNGLQKCDAGLHELNKYAQYYRRRNKDHGAKHVVPGNGKLICLNQTHDAKTPNAELPEASLLPISGQG